MVEFGILGSLSVSSSGTPVPVRAAKVRIVLATLLLRVGQVVSVNELTERLWDQDPPRNAKGAVQTYIKRLRDVLGEAGGLVETRPSGYAISIPPEAFDLGRYQLHRERARLAEASGDLQTESKELRAALRLWRGQPLSDVDSQWLQQQEVPPLKESFVQALERRIETDLALGLHAEVVGELRALVSEYRFREGLWKQLILALYRSNCQAEALDAYQDLRTMLHDELGVEPCEEIESLHRQVLKQDSQLDPPAPGVDRLEEPAPLLQLPASPADFIGRQEFVDRMLTELAPAQTKAGVPIVALSGPPGVGKTALAVHVGHLLRQAYPDGSLYIDMRGFSGVPPITASEALVRLLRTLGTPAERIPHDTDEQASLFRAVLADRRILLVIDNVANPTQVRPMIPGAAGSAVIITSRHRLHGLIATNGARPIALGPMQPAEASALLIAILGDRAGEEAGESARLTALCGYLPLAMRIAAASLAIMPSWSIAAYTEWLSVEDRVLALATDDGYVAVERAFELSYETLVPDLARLFRLLSTISGPDFDRYVVANLVQVTVNDAERMLDRLVAVNLLHSHAPLRYHFHDLIANYARLLLERHDGPDVAAAARRRLRLYYLHAASAARHVLYPQLPQLQPPARQADLIVRDLLDQKVARDWFEAEAMNLQAVIGDNRNVDVPLWVLADAMLVHFDRSDQAWLDLFAPLQPTVEQVADGRGVAALSHGLAKVWFKRWDLEKARELFGRAASASRDAADVFAECRAMNGLGCVAAELEEYEEATAWYEDALALLGKAEDEPSQVGILINYGMMLVELGRDHEGQHALTTANSISHAHGLTALEPKIRSSLAISAHWKGRWAEAARGYSEALESWRRLRVESGQAHSLRNLAEVYLEADLPEKADRLAQEALRLSERVGDAWMAVGAVATFGRTAFARGQRSLAREKLLAAHDLHPAGPRYWRSFIVLGLAACARFAGDGERAVELAGVAVADQRPRYNGQGRVERGHAYLMLGALEAAATDADTAIAIARRHGYLSVEAHAVELRGRIYRQIGDRSHADRCGELTRRLRTNLTRPD